MALVVPRGPGALRLEIERQWDGSAPPDRGPRGHLELSATESGLRIEGRLFDPGPSRVPDAPVGARVADLWHYDVLECFLVGTGEAYLEVELGAGGHFLVLSFDAPRQRRDEHRDLTPEVRHLRDERGWRTGFTLPWSCIPQPVRALNAFAIVGGVHLAFHPVPGAEPDFHQPGSYPAALLAPQRS